MASTGSSSTRPQDVDALDLRGEEQLLLPRAGSVDVDGGEDAPVGEASVEDDLHVAGALELEDHLVHLRAGLDERGAEDGEGAAVLDVPSRAEEALGEGQRRGLEAAGEELAVAGRLDVRRAREARDRVQEHDDVLAGLDQVLGLLHHHLGHLDVAGGGLVEGRGDDLDVRPFDGAGVDLLGALVDEQDDQLRVGLGVHDRLGEHVQQHRLARARRRDDQAALSEPDGGDQVDDPHLEGVLGGSLEDDPVVGVDRDELLERSATLHFLGLLAVDGLDLVDAEVAFALARRPHRAADEHPSLELVLLDQGGGDVDVVEGRHVVVGQHAQPVMPAGLHVEHALGDDRLAARHPAVRELPQRVAAVAPLEVLDVLLLRELVELVQVHGLHRREVVGGELLLARLGERVEELLDLVLAEVLGDLVEVDVDAGALLCGLLRLKNCFFCLKVRFFFCCCCCAMVLRWRCSARAPASRRVAPTRRHAMGVARGRPGSVGQAERGQEFLDGEGEFGVPLIVGKDEVRALALGVQGELRALAAGDLSRVPAAVPDRAPVALLDGGVHEHESVAELQQAVLRSVLHEERHVQHEPRHAVTDGGLEGSEQHLTNPGVDPPLQLLPGVLILEHPGRERGPVDEAVGVQDVSPVPRDDPGDDLRVLERLVGGAIGGGDPPVRTSERRGRGGFARRDPAQDPEDMGPSGSGRPIGRILGGAGHDRRSWETGGPSRNSVRRAGGSSVHPAGSAPCVLAGAGTPWRPPARAGSPRAPPDPGPLPSSTSGASLSGGPRSVIT